jgi:hypothetical protein
MNMAADDTETSPQGNGFSEQDIRWQALIIAVDATGPISSEDDVPRVLKIAKLFERHLKGD